MSDELAKLINTLIEKVDTLSYSKGRLLSCLEILLNNKELINDEKIEKEIREIISETY